MVRKPLRLSLLFAAFGLVACEKLPVSHVSGTDGRLDGDKKPAAPKSDKSDTDKDSEAVVPPQVISGAFLVCEVQRDPPPAINQATGLCALRDEQTRTKVDLANRFMDYAWKAEVPGINTVTSSSREMPANSSWHFQVQIKAGTAAQLDMALSGVQVGLSVHHANGRSEAMAAPMMKGTDKPYWQGLSDVWPTDAIPGGTTHMGQDMLGLCRIYAAGGVFPGKMLRGRDGDPMRCLTSREGSVLDNRAQDSDTLVSGTVPWTDRLEWVAVAPGSPLPANAYIGGVDDRGEMLLICRSLEAGAPPDPLEKPNDPLGEWTPGYVKASNLLCQYEYYGPRANPAFQILRWKVPPGN